MFWRLLEPKGLRAKGVCKPVLLVKGSTLLEVLIAMLLASLIFVLSGTIIINAFMRNRMVTEFYWQSIANNEMHRKLAMEDFSVKSSIFAGYSVFEAVEDYSNSPSLRLITVQVFDANGEELAIAKALVRDKIP